MNQTGPPFTAANRSSMPVRDAHGGAVRCGVATAVLLAAVAVPAVAAPARPYPALGAARCPSSAAPQPHLAARAETAAPALATRLWHPHPARTALRQLSGRIAAGPCDSRTGQFDLVHYRQWNSPPVRGVAVTEVVRWRADDRSGAQLAASHPAGVVPVSKDWWRPGDLFSAGLANPFGSSDRLRNEIGATSALQGDANGAVLAVARLATWYSPRRDARAATLGVLADLDGLTFYRRVIDRAGRSGIGVAAVAADGRRDLLILHPGTGNVLAYENARLTGTGWQVATYVLYLTHSHANRRWWEPPEPSAAEATPPRRLYPRPQQHWLLITAPPCHTASI